MTMDPHPRSPTGRRFTWTWRAGSRPGGGGSSPATEPPASTVSHVRNFFLRAISTAVGVFLATQIVPGIECRTWQGLVAVALLLGLFNAFVRPLLLVLSLPLLVVSLGLFLWVINAGLLSLAAYVVKPFTVASFWSALGGAAVISVVSVIGNLLLGVRRRPAAVSPHRSGPPQRPRDPPGGNGPVIDV